MKVLQINSICGIRSTGRICTDITKALNENGHESIIAYGRDPVPMEYRACGVRIGSVYRAINSVKAIGRIQGEASCLPNLDKTCMIEKYFNIYSNIKGKVPHHANEKTKRVYEW